MKYGIWGMGVVGNSVLRYLLKKGEKSLSVMDKRIPTVEEADFFNKNGIQYYSQDKSGNFFSINDYIIASPGINVAHMADYQHKIVPELDLFCFEWKKPLIAITGSLGKTSTVVQLAEVLRKKRLAIATGGNIGTGMLDLIEEQDSCDFGLLELSSFQLELSQKIAPDLAIITNIYPNHLDRHGSLEAYLAAKLKILSHQQWNQHALVPLSLAKEVRKITARPLCYFSMQEVSDEILLTELGELCELDTIYSCHDGKIIKISKGVKSIIAQLPKELNGFLANWIVIAAACDILKLGDLEPHDFMHDLKIIPAHRLERVPSRAPYLFYNDSKSTVLEATYAAVERLQPARIHLFLGGVSKGVDRTAGIRALKGKVVSVMCFGAEAEELKKACENAGIESSAHANLDDAFKHCITKAQPQDVILLSPAGASYDLYKIYTERGDHFKRLISELEDGPAA